jgi:hypothetical protein
MPMMTTIWPRVTVAAMSKDIGVEVRMSRPERVISQPLCLRIRALSSFKR